MYVYGYMYMYVYVYMNVNVCAFVHARMRACVHLCARVWVCGRASTSRHARLQCRQLVLALLLSS